MKKYIKYIILIVVPILLSCQSSDKNSAQNKKIYGITLDSINNIDQSIDSIKSFSKRVTTRLVFDKVSAKTYKNAIDKLSIHTDIMGELFDSEYIKDYSLDSYKKRVNEYLDMYGDKITIWEIGNEVNGEWTGDPNVVAQKTIYAYNEAKKRGYKTALTLYYNDFTYNDGCWSKPYEKMRDWAKERLSNELKNGIDFVFISYYEEDCDNYRPSNKEWESVFKDLENIFPNAKLGFGEIGTTNKKEKPSYLKRYYTLNLKNPNFIGGYFWWYFREDMIPKTKPLWSVLNKIILK